MTINNKYNFGDILYLKTDQEQHERIVTAIIVRPPNQIIYELTCGVNTAEHYEFEMTVKKDILKSLYES